MRLIFFFIAFFKLILFKYIAAPKTCHHPVLVSTRASPPKYGPVYTIFFRLFIRFFFFYSTVFYITSAVHRNVIYTVADRREGWCV